MKIQNPLLLPELLAAGDSKRLQVFCESGHPAEVAEQISELNAAEAWTVLRHAGSALRTEIFRHLDEDLQKETIYYAYVLNERRRLLGFVSLKDLIVGRREARVEDILHRDAIFARVGDDQEDAIDIITQEHTEDMEKLMAIAGSHENAVYMKTSIWVHFRNRSPWVVALAILGLVSGFIVQTFEGLLLQFAVLAAFMPMLADTGGTTGSQSATLVIRALAIQEISPKDILRIVVKEFWVSILLAMLLGGIAFARVILFGGGSGIPANFSLAKIRSGHLNRPWPPGDYGDADWCAAAPGGGQDEVGSGGGGQPRTDHHFGRSPA